MKKLIFLPLLFSAFYLSAFELYGLKSGMTKDEFYELTNCQAYIDNYNSTKSTYSDAKSLESCYSNIIGAVENGLNYFEGVLPRIYLDWTHDDRLWRADFTYFKKKGILQGIAFKEALQNAHPGKEIKETSTTSSYGTTEYLNVIYIDQALSDASINFYTEEFSKTIKNKK